MPKHFEIMESQNTPPSSILNFQQSLQPYIKSRQQTAHVRQLLATHLQNHVVQTSQHRLGSLSLPDPLAVVEPSSSIVRGLRKEYLKCVRINIKVQREYEALRAQNAVDMQGFEPVVDSLDQLTQYLSLIKKRQKQERLHILKNYIDRLSDKSAEITQKLNALSISNDRTTIPRVPSEVIAVESPTPGSSTKRDLRVLVTELEKKVLSAKSTLKQEKRALQRLQETDAANAQGKTLTAGERLHALSRTRHELIEWVEVELGKAGDSESPSENGKAESITKEAIEAQLQTVKIQYSKYLESRKHLLQAITVADLPNNLHVEAEAVDTDMVDGKFSLAAQLLPFMESLVDTSNEQKSLIQQRSHLTTSLAKQYKEMIQTFDRLADESHLMSSFPLPNAQAHRDYGTSTTFAEEISSREKPVASDRARAWTFAAGSAAINTKDTVSEHFEEGSNAIEDARQTLAVIDTLLGRNESTIVADVWASIDGNIGVIGREDD